MYFKTFRVRTWLMVLILLLTLPGAALAGIGDQPYTEWNLQGDVETEKQMEGQLFTIIGLSALATAPSAAGVGGPFALVVAGTGATSLAIAEIAKPENAIWENWPMGRYVFHHVPPDKFPTPGAMADRAVANVVESVANLIFSATKTLTRVSLNALVLAFHSDIVAAMVGWVSEGVAAIFAPQGELSRLLLSIGIIMLLIHATFRMLRGQAMSALSALLVSVLAVGGVFFFVTNAKQILTATARATDEMAGIFLGAVGRYTAAGQNINVSDPVDRGLVVAGQTVWQLVVAKPWAVAMFGTADESKLILTQDEYNVLDKSSFPEASRSKIQPGMRIDTLFLGSAGEGRDAVAEALARPNSKIMFVLKGEEIDHGGHPGTMTCLSPGSVWNHVMVAGLTLLPAIAFAFLAGTVALSIVVCQAFLAALLLVLPLALYAMMIPETGWALATRYFRSLLGFFMVKMVYGLYLSLVLVVGTGFVKAVMG